MQTIGIKELQTNPAILTKSLEAREYSMITKRSKPIGIAIAFDDEVLTLGLQKALLLEAYKNSLLSLGQLSKSLKISKKETLLVLSLMGIDVIDYDFKDDMKNMDAFL
jgi:hypothetical protein